MSRRTTSSRRSIAAVVGVALAFSGASALTASSAQAAKPFFSLRPITVGVTLNEAETKRLKDGTSAALFACGTLVNGTNTLQTFPSVPASIKRAVPAVGIIATECAANIKYCAGIVYDNQWKTVKIGFRISIFPPKSTWICSAPPVK